MVLFSVPTKILVAFQHVLWQVRAFLVDNKFRITDNGMWICIVLQLFVYYFYKIDEDYLLKILSK